MCEHQKRWNIHDSLDVLNNTTKFQLGPAGWTVIITHSNLSKRTNNFRFTHSVKLSSDLENGLRSPKQYECLKTDRGRHTKFKTYPFTFSCKGKKWDHPLLHVAHEIYLNIIMCNFMGICLKLSHTKLEPEWIQTSRKQLSALLFQSNPTACTRPCSGNTTSTGICDLPHHWHLRVPCGTL